MGAILLLMGIIYACAKRTTVARKNIPTKYIWLFMQLASTVVMLMMSFRLKVALSWDWGVVMRTAAYYVDSGIIRDPDYYAQYPNNQLWLVCLIVLFKIVRFVCSEAQMQQFQSVSIILICVLTQITILLIYKTAKILWNEKKALLTGGAAMLCLPIYLYAQFAYTDIPGMLLCALLMYLYIKRTKSDGKKQYIYLVLLGIVGAVAYKIKIMVVIVLLAIGITMFWKCRG